MFRILSYNHLITYSLLVILTFVLRFPSFESNYYGEDEAFYLTSAERIVDGGIQYLDTWDNKPPVILWVYSFFVWLFGSGAALAIRIFTACYIFLGAITLNQLINNNRLLNSFSLLPAFIYIILCSVPWYAQELNGEILITLPMILAVNQFITVKERASQNRRALFYAGLLLGLCVMIKYQAIFIFLGLSIAYVVNQAPRVSETFSLLSGFLMSIVITLLIIYLTGAFAAFWDIGVVYNLDYIRLGKNPGEIVDPLGNLWQYFKLWGPFIIVSLVAIANFRLSFFTNTIRLRKIELITLFWFGSCLLTVVIGGGRLYLHYFYMMAPVVALYAAKFYELKMRPWLKNGVFVLSFAMPAFTLLVFLISAYPQTFTFLDSSLTKDGWVQSLRADLQDGHPLDPYIEKERVQNGILVLDYRPKVYQKLGLPAATHYTNFSIAWYKFRFLDHNQDNRLISQAEPLRKIYEQFEKEKPEYIIDYFDVFPQMQKKLPLILGSYHLDERTQTKDANLPDLYFLR